MRSQPLQALTFGEPCMRLPVKEIKRQERHMRPNLSLAENYQGQRQALVWPARAPFTVPRLARAMLRFQLHNALLHCCFFRVGDTQVLLGHEPGKVIP